MQADANRRSRILVLLEVLQHHADPSVCLTGYRCMQQLILFTPQQVDVPSFVPRLQQTLESPHLLLRRASISILRQLVQRRPRVIHQHGDDIEALLFSMLDSQEVRVVYELSLFAPPPLTPSPTTPLGPRTRTLPHFPTRSLPVLWSLLLLRRRGLADSAWQAVHTLHVFLCAFTLGPPSLYQQLGRAVP